ncbi:MAG: hypothetical protein HUU55_22725 [Myxococcales bacterium]|nr:hypothetical protein [Myxococcales bacterium]
MALSALHEHFVALFRHAPQLAPLLLRQVCHVPIPDGVAVEGDSALGDPVPQAMYADKVVCLVESL